jgi:diadenosine tetraphosphate (Ap4A) HIT family hydrolase
MAEGMHMQLSRRLLFGSAVWEVTRPRTPLTAGHLMIRLSNPATTLDHRSAADWLRCHNAARRALADVLGADTCTLLFAHRWHALGAAIGEPAAESSTPTFHLFGRWDGEPVTPAGQLSLPAQRRKPAPDQELDKYDAGLRTALLKAATASVDGTAHGTPDFAADGAGSADIAEGDTEAAQEQEAPLPAIRAWAPSSPAGSDHTVLAPERTIGSVEDVTPRELLALAAALEALALRQAVTGLSCLVPDTAVTAGRLELHALGRSAGEAVNPFEMLLRSPEISPALL